jgi:hypothetical protein
LNVDGVKSINSSGQGSITLLGWRLQETLLEAAAAVPTPM